MTTAVEEVVDADVVDHPGQTQDLVPRSAGSTELIGGTPAERVGIATHMATALDDVIKRQGMRTKVGKAKVVQADGSEAWVDRYHVNVEGWQTLAAFLGLAVVPVWSRRVMDPVTGKPERVTYTVHETSYPKGKGDGKPFVERDYEIDGYSWEARVECYKDGALLGAGEAMCSRSEGTWKERDDYAVRGMAQTRATSRAIAGAARWIVTLAGYSGTPAEEMAGEDVEPEPMAMLDETSPEAREFKAALGALMGDTSGTTAAAVYKAFKAQHDGIPLAAVELVVAMNKAVTA